MSKISIVFIVIFCDEIIGSKNHRENSLSFSLLKSESIIGVKFVNIKELNNLVKNHLIYWCLVNENLLSV